MEKVGLVGTGLGRAKRGQAPRLSSPETERERRENSRLCLPRSHSALAPSGAELVWGGGARLASFQEQDHARVWAEAAEHPWVPSSAVQRQAGPGALPLDLRQENGRLYHMVTFSKTLTA
jgi:hypothetical protein